MPIKAGSLAASAPGKQTTMIFDGRRMRVVWAHGDGNGEPSEYLVERTINTMKGHPTWKVFCGDVALPIERGGPEPPRHVYLDDLACFTIWCSKFYSKDDLKTFWPFDFDNAGKIKTGRKNRGRPAYSDNSFTEYAKGPLRKKNQLYEFCGASSTAPPVAKKGSKGSSAEIKSEPGTPPRMPSQTVLPLTFPLSPLTRPTRDPYPECYDLDRELGNGRVPWKPEEDKRYIAGPADGSLLPIGMAHKAMQGSPYFDAPTSDYRTRPRPRAGDLTDVLGMVGLKRRRAEVEVPESIKELARVEAAKKRRRKYIKVEGGSATPELKRETSDEWGEGLELRFK